MRCWMHWLQWALVALVTVFVFTYAGDWALFKLRGSPRSKVTVNRYLTIPLKDNKQEFDYLGSFDTPCSISLFSQEGQSPCWQLRRNPNQWMAP
jgi:hypothetical protein